jgi:sialate O-acetylesterase
LDFGNKGGIYGKPEQLKLSIGTEETISLTGDWKYHTDTIQPEMDDLPPLPTIRHSANRPTVLFNGMISPLIPYGIKGVIWYQGESNAERAHQYRTLFRTHIQDWRTHWNKKDLPFLFVQLANFMKRKPEPVDDEWAELREAQLMTLSLPHTGMAVTIDIGDADDIHPKNKQDVGKRLALNALNLVYKKDLVCSGPVYKSMKVEGSKIRLYFDHVAGGLVSHDGDKLEGFSIAGSDKKFVWADAEIDGESIIVWNNSINDPVAVRYGWAANPQCNLYNKSGLPATPFRTDSWTGITEGKK